MFFCDLTELVYLDLASAWFEEERGSATATRASRAMRARSVPAVLCHAATVGVSPASAGATTAGAASTAIALPIPALASCAVTTESASTARAYAIRPGAARTVITTVVGSRRSERL